MCTHISSRFFFLALCFIYFIPLLSACSGGDDPKRTEGTGSNIIVETNTEVQEETSNINGLADIVGVWEGDVDITDRMVAEYGDVFGGQPLVTRFYVVITEAGEGFELIDASTFPSAIAANCYLLVEDYVDIVYVSDNFFITSASEELVEARRSGDELTLTQSNFTLDLRASNASPTDLLSSLCVIVFDK